MRKLTLVINVRELAAKCRLRAEAMTGAELDAWYVEHVGYSLLEDEPATTPAMLTASVATMMFFHACPDGLETPGAESMATRLEVAVATGQAL